MDSDIITINNVAYLYGIPAVPWGGQKNSGFGKSHGSECFLSLMDLQHISYDKGMFPNELWWMPYSKESSDAMSDMPKALFTQKSRMIAFLRRALPIYKRK